MRGNILLGAQGFQVSGRMAIYFRELESTGNYLQGFGEQAHSLGDLGSPAKRKKNYHLKLHFLLFF